VVFASTTWSTQDTTHLDESMLFKYNCFADYETEDIGSNQPLTVHISDREVGCIHFFVQKDLHGHTSLMGTLCTAVLVMDA
jgi:hypothetical protein